MHPTTSLFETCKERDRRTGEVRRSSVNDERSNARRVVHAGVGRRRDPRRSDRQKLARAVCAGNGGQVGRKTGETHAARTQVNGAGTPMLDTRGVMVVTIGGRMGSMPFSHEVHGILDDLAEARDQSPEKEDCEANCCEPLHESSK
jgi:hypothetical protein